MHQTGQEGYIVGLIGSGIADSLSPALHEREAACLGLDYAYRLFDLDELGRAPEAVGDLVREARRLGLCGVNVTHPCKQLVVPALDELSPEAAALGAVNTIVFDGDRLVGHNTDTTGFQEAFERGLPGAATGTSCSSAPAAPAPRSRTPRWRSAPARDRAGRRGRARGGAGRRAPPPVRERARVGSCAGRPRPAARRGRRADPRDADGHGGLSRDGGAGRAAPSRPLGGRGRLRADRDRAPLRRARARLPDAQRRRDGRAAGGGIDGAVHRRAAGPRPDAGTTSTS